LDVLTSPILMSMHYDVTMENRDASWAKHREALGKNICEILMPKNQTS